MKIQTKLKMESDRRKNKIGRRIRKAAEHTSETKGGSKEKFGVLGGVICH